MLKTIEVPTGYALRLIATAFLVLAIVTAATRPLAAQEQIRIKLATLAPNGTSPHKILMAMGQEWQKESNGRITLTIYPGGVMGDEAESVRRMRMGQLQAAMLTVNGLAEIEPSVKALQNLPFMFRSLGEVEEVRKQMRAEMEKRFLNKGFVVLFWGDVGWVRWFSRRPVVHPDDLKKMKVFTLAGDPQQVQLMEKLGLHPVPLSSDAILMALQTGMIDAVPSPPFFALAGQFYGPAPYMLEMDYAPLVGGVVITKKAWDQIPPDLQPTLLGAARKAEAEMTSQNRAESDESVAAMEKRGLKVQAATPALEAEWRRFAEPAFPTIRGTLVPADTFDQVQSILREYRGKGGTGQ
jgi:TRAP-type transport system periplasmic protein